MSCRGFLKDNNTTVILICCRKLVLYYLSKWSVVIENNPNDLRDVTKCVNQQVKTEG